MHALKADLNGLAGTVDERVRPSDSMPFPTGQRAALPLCAEPMAIMEAYRPPASAAPSARRSAANPSPGRMPCSSGAGAPPEFARSCRMSFRRSLLLPGLGEPAKAG